MGIVRLIHRGTSSFLPVLVLLLMSALHVRAQCANVWLPGDGIRGTNGVVSATTTWDPDGLGPAVPLLVVAGNFSVAGNAVANRIATWNPATGDWAALGSGIDYTINVLTTMANGDLVAGGDFNTAGGLNAMRIARWNGTSWSPFGPGINGRVWALTTLPNGDLVAAGYFAIAGTVVANGIARWDGTQWHALGSGVSQTAGTSAGIRALTTLANGDLVAAGVFDTAGGVSAKNIARWDGSSWSPLGSGIDGPSSYSTEVRALITLPNGDVVAGGWFSSAGSVSANAVARWDGTSWSSLGAGLFVYVSVLSVLPNGGLVAGGSFSSLGTGGPRYVAHWDGTSWAELGLGINDVVATFTSLPNGDLIAGGRFINPGGTGADYVAAWDGATWAAVSSGINGLVESMATLSNGDLVVGGRFSTAGDVLANCVAQWNGAVWSALGAGMNGYVHCLATLPNGDLVAGGRFTTAGGTGANRIARWDGASWSPLGSGMNGWVYSLATLPNGDLVAGGDFTAAGGVTALGIARWDGGSWTPIGWGMTATFGNASIYALTTMANGDLVAGGDFWSAGSVVANSIARWDGATWSALGSGMSQNPIIFSLTTLHDGSLVAGGIFDSAGGVNANGIAQWDGAAWSSLGAGMPYGAARSLTTLPNGDLVAGGYFPLPAGLNANIRRWNGTLWSALGPAVDGVIYALAMLPSGELAVGGDFLAVGGALSARLARLTTTCPATSVSNGGGCSASALTSTLPWTGSTLRLTATGLPLIGIAFGVCGFTTVSIPMTAIIPEGVVGCSLSVAPDILDVYLPSAGRVDIAVGVPDAGALVGLVIHFQVASIEYDLNGTALALTSTNALALTIGGF